MNDSTKKQALYFLALTALGFAGNCFGYEIFFSISFIFGSVFTLLALQVLGPRLGIASAFIGAAGTYLLWNHPYVIVIMTAEAAFVAFVTGRKKLNFVLADALYWCLAGMPLVFAFHFGLMHLAINTATITMLKQAVNGVANALAARFVFMLYTYYRGKTERFSLREILFDSLLLFTIAPSLLFIAIESRTDQLDTDNRLRQSLHLTGQRATVVVQDWLDSHLHNVTYLAELAGQSPVGVVQQAIEHVSLSGSDFLRMGVLDDTATIVAYWPPLDDRGQPNVGKNFADRPFIPVLKATLKPMLSEVVMGKIGKPQPIVPVLAPIVKGGAYAGYVTGILNLTSLRRATELGSQSSIVPGLTFVILDKNDRVVVTNKPGLATMEAFRRDPGVTEQLEPDLSEWLPLASRNVSISDRWKKGVYIQQTNWGVLSEWRLVLDAPVEPFQRALFAKYTGILARVWVIIAFALVAAHFLSRIVLGSLERLRTLSSDLSDRVAQGQPVISQPSIIDETESLQANFQTMGEALRSKFDEIRAMNTTLEQRIEQRTRELSTVNAKLSDSIDEARKAQRLIQGIFDSAPLGIAWSDAEGRIEYVNQRFVDYTGYSIDDVPTVVSWFERAYPDPAYREQLRQAWADVAQQARATGTTAFGPVEAWITCRNGERRCFDVAGALLPKGQLAVFSDMTVRKSYEQRLSAYSESRQVLLREVNHRVKNNLVAILGMMRLEEGKAGSPPFNNILKELEGRVLALSAVHSMLSSSEWRPIPVDQLCGQIVSDSLASLGVKNPRVRVEGSKRTVGSSVAHNLALVINELAVNTAKYAGELPDIEIRIDSENHELSLVYRDGGPGFPDSVLRGETGEQGIGIKLVKGLVESSLRGRVDLRNDHGAVVALRFPVDVPEETRDA